MKSAPRVSPIYVTGPFDLNSVFRLIPCRPYTVSLNMAIDEILMDSQNLAGIESMPTLRFYSWTRPAATAGYFQKLGDLTRRLDFRKRGLEMVRRLTGGGLVLHGPDLTFSLSMKIPHPLLAGNVKDSYLKINEVLLAGLGTFYKGLDFADCKTVPSGRGGGPERVCFEAPSCYDLLWNSKKVVGASQRRKNGVLLHQSSVFLDKDVSRVEKLIVAGFKKKWAIVFEEIPLKPDELERAKDAERKRYGSPEWAL